MGCAPIAELSPKKNEIRELFPKKLVDLAEPWHIATVAASLSRCFYVSFFRAHQFGVPTRNSGNPPFLSKTPTSTLFFPAIGAKFECRRSEITRLSEHSESFWT